MVSVGVSRIGKTSIVFVEPEPRLTANITVNMLSVAVYYLTSVQDASATPGPGGTAAAASPPFRVSDPALCGSRPLVIPYYCRLGDLLCLFCVYRLCVIIVYV